MIISPHTCYFRRVTFCVCSVLLLGILATNLFNATSVVFITENAQQPQGCFIPTEVVTRIAEQAHQFGYLIYYENSKNYNPKSLANADYIIDLTDNSLFARFHCHEYLAKFIIFIWEPPTVMPELWDQTFQNKMAGIFTFDDKLVDNKRYFKLHYPAFWGAPHDWPQNSFAEKKLCTMILANKKSSQPSSLYAIREHLITFFEREHREDFEFFGVGWNKQEHSTYHGAPEGSGCLRNYRFCFCFENTAAPGYITEKIFNIFVQKAVPVYLGATNVNRYIPDNCFINFANFASFENCYQFLKKMDETAYDSYILNIKKYLSSEQINYFKFRSLWSEILVGSKIIFQRGETT